jgi:hypothetical protein
VGNLGDLLVAHFGQCRRVGHEVGVGGLHAVHIGVDFHRLSAQGSPKRGGGRVAAPAPQRRNRAAQENRVRARHALKPRHDWDPALLQAAQHGFGVDFQYPRVAELVVGDDARLVARQRDGRVAQRAQRLRHHDGGDNLAARHH